MKGDIKLDKDGKTKKKIGLHWPRLPRHHDFF